MSLFGPVLRAYSSNAALSNDELYEQLSGAKLIASEELHAKVPIGKSGEKHSPAKRRVRWIQQSLRQLGLLERVADKRGVWQATEKGRKGLTMAVPGKVMLAFSTDLGIALWAECQSVFSRIDEPVHLVLSSPPYPLAVPRNYGGPTEVQYVDFICQAIEPVLKHLVPGGTICLNVTNDAFLSKSPARSTYRERLVLALCDMGLFKVDELIWHNNSKAPGPIQWASKQRFQLNTAWEPIYVFTNDPSRLRPNNQRVLQPHSERHLRLMAKGGETRTTNYGDGANRMRPGAFGRVTAGKIPKNVLSFGHRCHDQNELRKIVTEKGLPVHGATMPKALAAFLVEYLTEKGDLVADLFGGWLTTAAAAEELGRRWIASEAVLEYVFGASHRKAFTQAPGFCLDSAFAQPRLA
jgi:site-specific DNA-methyltransferase (cytosine-N4-specific)